MFENIGSKIKKLAKFCAFACIISGVIVTLYGGSQYFSNAEYLEYATVYGGSSYYYSLEKAGNEAYMGLQLLKFGLIAGVAGFVSSWPLYGFGELIEKVSFIADTMKKENEIGGHL